MIHRSLTLAFCFIASIAIGHSQVLIGKSVKPVDGALLQLDNSTAITGTNSTKGLGLPRVALAQSSKLYPMYDYVSEIPSDTDKKEHTALLVMNTTENELLCKGMHVWNGETWVPLLSTEISYFEDVRVSNVDATTETNVYPIQEFGSAGTWMLTNLRTSLYPDGTPIEILPNTGTIGDKALYYYYPPKANGSLNITDDKNYYEAHPYLGYFYTWNAATGGVKVSTTKNEGEGAVTAVNATPQANATPSNVEKIGVQGVCPNGWHLPSDYEMNRLEEYISNNGTTYYNNSGEPTYTLDAWQSIWNIASWETDESINISRGNAGKAMMSPYYENGGLSRKICEGTSGFSAYVVGFIRNVGANPQGVAQGVMGDYWTSSKASANTAWYRSYIFDETAPNYYPGTTRLSISTSFMMSVRCKKN